MRKRFFQILLFLLLLSVFFNCQQQRAKSITPLTSAKERIAFDSIEKFDSLVNITKLRDPGSAIVYATKAMKLSKNYHVPLLTLKANILMGLACYTTKLDSSYYYFSRALEDADKYFLEKEKPVIFFNLSNIYNQSYDYKTSLVFLDSAISYGKKYHNFTMLSNAFNSIGMIKLILHDSANAKIMFDSAFQLADKHSLYRQMGIALGNQALYETNTSRSISLQKKAIKLLQKSSGNEESIAFLLVNIGNNFDNIDSAIHYYHAATSWGESDEVVIGAMNNLAYGYLDKHKYAEAEKCLTGKAIPLAEKNQNYDWLSALYDTYSDVLLAQGRGIQAANMEKRAYQNREKAYDKQSTGQVRLLAILLGDKNKELQLQENKQELQKKEASIQRMKYIGTIIFLLIGIAMFVTMWLAQRNKLKFQKELVASAKLVIDLEENLKGQVAMELHDMTSPLYSTLLRQIEETEIPDTEIKRDIQDKLSDLADQIRQLSHKIGKIDTEHFTFDQLLRGLCNDMQYLTLAKIKLEIYHSGIQLSSEKITHLVRIIQELLTNAVKYVKTGDISLCVSHEFNNINIIYQDNGPGFDQNNSMDKGIGLTNIFERTKMLGGKANVQSSVQQGTRWVICVPC